MLAHEIDSGFEPVLGDVRDRDKLIRAFRQVDIVFHAAALKHVPLCEQYPLEAVQTNILGVQNVIHAAFANGLSRVVYMSTDKAVNSPNVMGTSKLMGEQLIRAASFGDRGQVFSSTRFGNVLGSRGSVLPIFKRQIKAGGPITLTSAEMTRFVMTLDEAVSLVLEAAALARGGDVFITKMASVRIIDLAEVMIEELAPSFGHRSQDIAIIEIGPRAGEKFAEELMTSEEIRRSIELEHHFVILPALTDLYTTSPDAYPDIKNRCVIRPYHSSNEPAMSKDEIRKCLVDTGLHSLEVDS